MPILDPEIRKQRRKERHERDKARALVDPEYAARRREIDKNAKKKYEMKKKIQNLQKEKDGPVGKGKPGRIVALCGWMHW